MTTAIIIIVVVAVAVAIIAAVVGWALYQKRRSGRFEEEFGPEYGRTVQERGGRREAESELEARRKRVEALDIRPLAPEDRERYVESWRSTQAEFVDAPDQAISGADRLVAEVMQKRGYPVGDFERQAADISVDHPQVVNNYRAAHEIAVAQERGEARTEDLRQGMIHYRALFEELLGGNGASSRRAG